MYNYPPPEGFTLDPVSGMYYLEQQIETTSGPMRLITWFNPETGEYTQQMIPLETAPKRKGRGKKPAALAAALAFVTIVIIADTMFDNDDASQQQSSSATASGSYSPQHKEDWGRFGSASGESLPPTASDPQGQSTASSSLGVNDPSYEGSEETPDDMEEEAQVWAYYICTTAQGIDYDVDQWFIMTIMTDETVYFRITLADGSTEELTCHAESFPEEWIMRLTVEQTEAAKKLGLTTIEFAYNENLNFLLLTPNVGVGGYGDEYRDAPWMQNQ